MLIERKQNRYEIAEFISHTIITPRGKCKVEEAVALKELSQDKKAEIFKNPCLGCLNG
jgi:hypothetical protein